MARVQAEYIACSIAALRANPVTEKGADWLALPK
jgi:hypothetical protein